MLTENTLFAERYQLLRLLGRGGFSEVWLANDTKTKVQVALKVYAPGQGVDDAGIALFTQEFALVFALNHTNLLHPSHYDSWQQMPYLILPFCKNGSASAFLAPKAHISEDQCWRLIHDVAAGLAYLHEQTPPVIHQDIKPDNILISDAGNYMITDFGISARIRTTMSANGQQNDSSGTLPYMGPERFCKDPKPILASDIWSLGAMLFELMTKNPPFGNHGGLLQKGGAEIPTIDENYSDDLKGIVYQCLAKEPRDRPSAQSLVTIADDRTFHKPAEIHAQTDYDVFISYRRVDGAQYARILQLGLEKRGLRVFLDYDELNDGVFGDNIKEAIAAAPIFMPILSPQYLDRCKNVGDWVREEIMLAIRQKKRIVPVDPDKSFGGFPPDVPSEIQMAISAHLYSDIFFGQLMNASIDEMVKKRILPYVSKAPAPTPSKPDAAPAQEAPKARTSKGKWIAGALAAVIIVFALVAYLFLKDGGNDNTSFSKSYSKALVKAAEDGIPLAQFYLGLAYENGYGVIADAHKAVEWYTKAAEQGLDSAQVSLATCLFKEIGVRQDTDKAIEWLHRAAGQGNVDAMFNLGTAYFKLGQMQEAREWLQRAADNGSSEAQKALGQEQNEQDEE